LAMKRAVDTGAIILVLGGSTGFAVGRNTLAVGSVDAVASAGGVCGVVFAAPARGSAADISARPCVRSFQMFLTDVG
jgi:hypothetical protein